jgi:hypothetical protein
MIDSRSIRHLRRLVVIQRRAEDAWSAACAAGEATRAHQAAQHIVKAEYLIVKLGDGFLPSPRDAIEQLPPQ